MDSTDSSNTVSVTESNRGFRAILLRDALTLNFSRKDARSLSPGRRCRAISSICFGRAAIP